MEKKGKVDTRQEFNFERKNGGQSQLPAHEFKVKVTELSQCLKSSLTITFA